MIHKALEVIQNINDYQTPLGKIGLTLDGVGVVLSVGFYGLGLGELINSVAPPIILVLTVFSLSLSLIIKVSSEFRAWKKRKESK